MQVGEALAPAIFLVYDSSIYDPVGSRQTRSGRGPRGFERDWRVSFELCTKGTSFHNQSGREVKKAMVCSPVAVRDYGAFELRQSYQKYWLYGFGIAVIVHLVVVCSYYASRLFADSPSSTAKVTIRYIDVLPPSIIQRHTPPPINPFTAVKPSIGKPVPVPDAEVNPEQIFATQEEMSQVPGLVEQGLGEGEVVVDPDILIEEGPPPDFRAVEKHPQIIRQVKPEYPGLAIRAGLEGKVWVKIWVDKEGRPHQVNVVKSDAEIFNEPALAAARQFLFTPAYMNNGPVSVWVSIPFHFKLDKSK